MWTDTLCWETRGTLTELLANLKNAIYYIPDLARLTGKVTAALLLQQVIQYSGAARGRIEPFYKFRAPCEHTLYRPGDSWLERLAFSPKEFDTALRTIGTKIRRGESKKAALGGGEIQHLVLYWTDSSRVTWYLLNGPLFERKLRELKAAKKDTQHKVP